MDAQHPVKVAHIITRLIVGGAQENTLATVEGLQNTHRYAVTLITGPEQGPEGSLLPRLNRTSNVRIIPALRRNLNPLYDVLALLHLWWVIRTQRFEIVHTHSSKAGILGRLAARLNRVPIVVHTVHGLPFFAHQHTWLNRLYVLLERFAARGTSRIVCVAPAMIKQAQRARIGSPEQYRTIYSGIAVESFAPDERQRYAIRKRLSIPPQALVIGKIARLFPLKGHVYLLQAAARLKSRFPSMVLLLIGDGILRRRIESQARALGLSDTIRFTGLVAPEEIPRYVQAFDLLAHVSLREGLPRVVVQAAAAGIPSVCFAVDGAVDLVREGKEGFLVPPKDIDTLVDRLALLLGDKERRSRMGAAARIRVHRLFSQHRMVRGIDALYQELLTGKTCSPARKNDGKRKPEKA